MFPVYIFIHFQLMYDVFSIHFFILLRCSFFLNNWSRVVQQLVLPLFFFSFFLCQIHLPFNKMFKILFRTDLLF